MAIKWRRLLGEHHPDLAQVADFWDSINTDTESSMCDSELQKKKKVKKAM